MPAAAPAPAARDGNGGRSAYESAQKERTQSTRARFTVHGSILGMVICTLGDLLMDIVVKLAQPLAQGDDTRAETRVAGGGQAANVAAWSAALGAEARFVGKRGADAAGEVAEADLLRRAVDVLGPPPHGRNGVVVSLVEENGERTMVSDRGVAPDLSADELQPDWFDRCDWLHLSGYSLMREPIGTAAERAAELALERGARISVDLSSVNVIRDFGADRVSERLSKVRPDVVFGNEAEHGEVEVESEVVVIKRGPNGATFDGQDYPVVPGEVLDTTGAGDALAAGYLVGGPRLAMEAAARCVAGLGTMP
jgi:sugar/nucleoside kinase (ribokinase family)